QSLPHTNAARASHTAYFNAVGHAIGHMIIGRQWMHLGLARETARGAGKKTLVVIRVKRRSPFLIFDRALPQTLSAEELVPVHGHAFSLLLFIRLTCTSVDTAASLSQFAER